MKTLFVVMAVVAGLLLAKARPKFAAAVFTIYLLGVNYYTLLQRFSLELESDVFEPFLTGKKMLRSIKNVVDYLKTGKGYSGEIVQVGRDALLNIIMFAPLGYLLPVVAPITDGWWKIAIVAFSTSSMIEILQQTTKLGMFDAFDLLYNTLGAVLGYIVYRKYLACKKN